MEKREVTHGEVVAEPTCDLRECVGGAWRDEGDIGPSTELYVQNGIAYFVVPLVGNFKSVSLRQTYGGLTYGPHSSLSRQTRTPVRSMASWSKKDREDSVATTSIFTF